MIHSVDRIPILTLIILFLIYLVIHYLIGRYSQKAEKKYNESSTLENEKAHKILKTLFVWFPALYVILLLAFFYIQ